MSSKNIFVKMFSKGYLLSFGDYILASGVRTSYYIDFSYLADRPDYLSRIVRLLIGLIKRKVNLNDVDKLVGVLNKGALILPQISIKLDKPFVLLNRSCTDIALGHLSGNEKLILIFLKVSRRGFFA